MGCKEHTARALKLTSELLELANESRDECQHDGCLMLDGVVRDCAWKIRRVALQWRRDLEVLEKPEENSRGDSRISPRTNL